MVAGADSPAPPRPAGAADKRRKRRRRLRIALIVVAAVLLLVGLTPYVLSTGAATRWIVGMVNDRLVGTVAIDDLSLGWLGPCRVKGLRVTDTDGREVLRVEQITWDKGLLSAVRLPERFGRVTVAGPRAVLYLADGDLSLAEAFERSSLSRALRAKRPRPKPKRPKPPTRAGGTAAISGGSVRIVRADGRTMEIADVAGEFDVGLPESLAGTLSAALPAAAVEAEIAVTQGPAGVGMTGRCRLAGEIGDAKARWRYAPGGPAAPGARQLASAILAGEPFALPEVELDVEPSRLDAAALVRAVGALVPLRRDVEITGGTLTIEQVHVRGGSAPETEIRIDLKGLAARRGSRAIAFDPVGLDVKALVDAKAGLSIERAKFTSDFATVSAAGSARDLKGAFEAADLDRLHARLAEIADVGAFALGGRSSGTFAVARDPADPNRANVTLAAEAKDLIYADGARRLSIPSAEVKHAGYAIIKGRKVRRIVASQAGATVGPSLAATGTGWYDFDSGQYAADVQLTRADVAALIGWGRALAPAETSSLLADSSIQAGEMVLSGRLSAKDQRLDAAADLTAGGRKFHLAVKAPIGAEAPTMDAEGLLWAVLAGQPVAMPDVQFSADGGVDLAMLARAAPALLRAGGLVVIGGAVRLEKVTARGGAAPAAVGRIAVTGVAVRRDKRTVAAPDVSGEFDLAAAAGEPLRIRRVHLAAPFGHVTAAHGSALKCEVVADLAKLHAQISPLLGRAESAPGRGAPEDGGQVTATVTIQPPAGDRLTASLVAGVKALRHRAGSRRFAVARADVTSNVEVTFKDRKPVKVALTRLAAGADDAVAVEATGAWDLSAESAEGVLTVRRADLAALCRMIGWTEPKRPSPYAGALTAKVGLIWSGKDGAVGLTDLAGTVKDFLVNGQAVTAEDVTFACANAQVAPGQDRWSLTGAGLTSTFATLAVPDLGGPISQPWRLAGKVAVAADVAKALAAATPAVGWAKTPALAGQLKWDGACTGAGDQTIAFTGGGAVTDVAIGAGAQAIRIPRIGLTQKGQVDLAGKTITVAAMGIDAAPSLSVTASGTVGRFDTVADLDLSGKYTGAGEVLTALLRELAPQQSAEVAVTGPVSATFTAKGPIRAPQIRPAFGKLDAGGSVAWTKIDAHGIILGKADLRPQLAGGVVSLPATDVAAGDGLLRLAGKVDFSKGEPVLEVPKLQLARDVPLSLRMGENVLSRIHPIFFRPERLSGKASLTISEPIVLGLGKTLKTSGSGRGQLDLGELKIRSGGILMDILKFGGLTNRLHTVKTTPVDFQIHDGQVHYQNFAMVFAGGFTMTSAGWVGFDDRLDLTVKIPLRLPMLNRVKGKLAIPLPVENVLKILGDVAVPIHIKGTRQKPRLVVPESDIVKIILEVLKRAPLKIPGVLDGLLKPRQPTTATAPATGPARRRRLIDALDGLLDRDKDKKPK